MTWQLVPLAHAGEGATWQALLTTIALGLGIVFVLVLLDWIELTSMGDLVLPLAAVAILSSLSPALSESLSDWVGWAAPAGLVALLALVLAAGTDLEIGWTSPLAIGAVVLAVAGSLLLGSDLNNQWHATAPTLPLSDDATLTIVEPEDQATVSGDTLVVRIELEGGTVGPGDLTEDELPDDPEELGRVRLFVDGTEPGASPEEDCTVESPCTTLTYRLEDVAAGAHSIIAEFVRGDGVPLAPSVFDRTGITVE